MLRHAKLDTNQIYIQISIQKLMDIDTATHPEKIVILAKAEIQKTKRRVNLKQNNKIN